MTPITILARFFVPPSVMADLRMEWFVQLLAMIAGLYIFFILLAIFTYKSKLIIPIKIIFFCWIIYMFLMISPEKKSQYEDDYYDYEKTEENLNPNYNPKTDKEGESFLHKIVLPPNVMLIVTGVVVIVLIGSFVGINFKANKEASK